MAKSELGSKRACQECSTKFFDFNRRPIVCPKCGAVFVIATRDKMRRAEAEPKKEVAEDASPAGAGVAEKAANDTAGTDKADGEVEVISLEDAEEKGGDDPDNPDEDDTVAGLPDDEIVIDTADDDDDVSDLVVSGGDSDDT